MHNDDIRSLLKILILKYLDILKRNTPWRIFRVSGVWSGRQPQKQSNFWIQYLARIIFLDSSLWIIIMLVCTVFVFWYFTTCCLSTKNLYRSVPTNDFLTYGHINICMLICILIGNLTPQAKILDMTINCKKYTDFSSDWAEFHDFFRFLSYFPDLRWNILTDGGFSGHWSRFSEKLLTAIIISWRVFRFLSLLITFLVPNSCLSTISAEKD